MRNVRFTEKKCGLDISKDIKVGFSEKIHGSPSLWMFKGEFGKKNKDSDSVYSARFQLCSRLLL